MARSAAAENNHDHDGHNHEEASKGKVIIEHVLNPSSSLFRPSDFVNDLFSEYGTGLGASKSMDLDGLVQVYQALGIIPGFEEGGHDGHDHSEHNHLAALASLEKRQDEFDPCLLPFDILSIYKLNTTSRAITPKEFETISPALIYASAAKICKNKVFQFNTTESDAATTNKKISTSLVWLYSFIANTIVTLGCMAGIAFVPMMRRSPFLADLFLSFFVALGAGTLIADSLLHLVPSVLELHVHSLGEEAHNHGPVDPLKDFPFVWDMSIVMLGLYLFWSAEQLLHFLHSSSGNHSSHVHSHYGHTHSHRKSSGSSGKITLWHEIKTVKPVAILILLGDTMHNFVDGLAIGASFSHSLKLGITTSIAVLLHELPHELGDYAILYASGFSAIRAAILNAMSNVTAYIGMILGIVIVNSVSSKSQKVLFAIAAGTFLYIAIADLLPELRKVHAIAASGHVEEVAMDEEKDEKAVVVKQKEGIHPFSWPRIVAQHLGLAVGWLIMVLIAVYGENIKV
ncbi:hypothetical protein HDU97_008196 [Phlyctochytrium planicorne]|nr:hypothetical protein HDU97_008196 [Phlyctochytrium planicorne]